MASPVFNVAVLANIGIKRGPSPSRASVEAGQESRIAEKLLPTLKKRRFAIGKFAVGIENALAPFFVVLVSHPI